MREGESLGPSMNHTDMNTDVWLTTTVNFADTTLVKVGKIFKAIWKKLEVCKNRKDRR